MKVNNKKMKTENITFWLSWNSGKRRTDPNLKNIFMPI